MCRYDDGRELARHPQDAILLDPRALGAGGLFSESFPDSRILSWTRKREQEPVLPDLPVPPKTDDIHEYFDREESAIFEIKGSAFAPLEPWLGRAGGASNHDGLIESKNNEHFRKTIGKTTVAMLNSQGGEIFRRAPLATEVLLQGHRRVG